MRKGIYILIYLIILQYIKFSSDKTWFPSAATCPALPISKNLTVFGSSSAVDSIVKFNCTGANNILEGPSVLQCSINGKWNGSVPTCHYLPPDNPHFNTTTPPESTTPLIESIAQVESTQQHVVIWVIGAVVLVVLIFFIFCLVKKRLKWRIFGHSRFEDCEADNPSFINEDAWMWIAAVVGTDGPSRARGVRSSVTQTSTDDQQNDEMFANVRLPTYSEAVATAIESQRAIFATGANITNSETSSYQTNETVEVARLKTIQELSHILKHAVHSSKPLENNDETLPSADLSSCRDDEYDPSNLKEVSEGTARNYETQDAHETVDHVGSHVELNVESQQAMYTKDGNITYSESISFQPSEAAEDTRPKTIEEITNILKHATHTFNPLDYEDETFPADVSSFHDDGNNFIHVENSEPSGFSFDEVNHVSTSVEIAHRPDILLLKPMCLAVDISQPLEPPCERTIATTSPMDLSKSLDFFADIYNPIRTSVDFCHPSNTLCDIANAFIGPSEPSNTFSESLNTLNTPGILSQLSFCHMNNPMSSSVDPSQSSNHFCDEENPIDLPVGLSPLSDPFCGDENLSRIPVDVSIATNTFCDINNRVSTPVDISESSDLFNLDDAINTFAQSRVAGRCYSSRSGENDVLPTYENKYEVLSEHDALKVCHSNSRRSSADIALQSNPGKSLAENGAIPAPSQTASNRPYYRRSISLPVSSNKLGKVANGFKKAFGEISTS